MSRYVVRMDFFVWADSEEEAKSIAESKAKKEKDYYDNRAEVITIHENDFGSLYHKEVYNINGSK